MKRIITLVAAAVLCACGGKEAAYKNALPKDAVIVVGIKIDQLGRKINAKDFANSGIAKIMRTESDLAEDKNELIISLLSDPKESGLSLTDDVYLFYLPGDTQTKGVGAVARVADRKKVDEVFTKAGFTSTEQDGRTVVKYHETGTHMAVYNDETFIIMESQQDYSTSEPMVAGLFTQKEGYFTANKAAADMLNGGDDICAVMGYNKVMEQLLQNNPMVSTMSSYMEMYKGVLLAVKGNFEKGQIVVDALPIYTDKDTEKKMLELTEKMVGKKLNGNVLKFIPEDAILAMAVNIKGAGMYETLNQQSELQATLAQVPMMKGIVEAIEGDMAFALTAFDGNMPRGAVFVELGKPDVITGYAAMAATIGAKAVEGAENQFIFSQGGIEAHFGVKDNTFYMTNDPRIVAAMGGEKIASVADKAIFAKGAGSGFVNFAALLGIKNLTDEIDENMMPFAQALSSLEFSSVDNTTSRIVLNMTDTSVNAAEVFYTLIDALAVKEAASDVVVEETLTEEAAA